MAPHQSQSAPSVKKTLFGAACLSLQPLVLNAISLPVMAYIIRQLGADGYGQWMAATSLLAVAAMLSNPGLRIAFVRRIAADPGSVTSALAEQLGLRLLLACLMSLVVILACLLLGYPSAVLWCTVIGAAGLLMTTVATTLTDVLQALHRSPTIAAVSMAAGVVLTLTSAVAAWLGVGPVTIALTYLTGPTVSLLVLWCIVCRNVCVISARFDPRNLKALLVGSRHFAAQQLLTTGSAQVVALILPLLIGLDQFGFFTAGALIANRLMVIPDALCTAAYPALVSEYARGKTQGSALTAKYLAIAGAGGIAVALGGVVGAELIGHVLFPGQSALFATVVRITIWSLPLVAVEAVMGYALNAAGREADQARVSVPAAVVSLLGSVALVLAFGVMGACWAMLLRTVTRSAFLLPVIGRTFRTGVDSERGPTDALDSSTLLRKAG